MHRAVYQILCGLLFSPSIHHGVDPRGTALPVHCRHTSLLHQPVLSPLPPSYFTLHYSPHTLAAPWFRVNMDILETNHNLSVKTLTTIVIRKTQTLGIIEIETGTKQKINTTAPLPQHTHIFLTNKSQYTHTRSIQQHNTVIYSLLLHAATMVTTVCIRTLITKSAHWVVIRLWDYPIHIEKSHKGLGPDMRTQFTHSSCDESPNHHCPEG